MSGLAEGRTEREGFEPSIEFPLYSISSAAPSTTRPPLQARNDRAGGNLAAQPASVAVAPLHRITIHDRQRGVSHSAELPEGELVLQSLEALGQALPFSCRNGCCTACAVRVLSGTVEQREALGLSHSLRQQGYALLCVARVVGPLEAETQDEDEVYMLQFGRSFARGRLRPGLPLDDD